MALLTEEQVLEIRDLHTKWWNSKSNSYLDLLVDWNEKQTASWFEPDWGSIPDDVMEVQLKMNWLKPDTGDCYYDPCLIKIYKRPLKAHPHAEMIMKYAEVAQRRVDPWVEFQVNLDNNWEKIMGNPAWLDYREYRYIGETK